MKVDGSGARVYDFQTEGCDLTLGVSSPVVGSDNTLTRVKGPVTSRMACDRVMIGDIDFGGHIRLK